ncbi:MAG: DUF4411 family protein [Spirochaetales bacterium]|nr:DUF4411 family protein [Spirochaetales bacterium]
MNQFLLDANIFIQANRFHYPFDVFPGFWEWLDGEMKKGVVTSIYPIYEELKAGNDFLTEWAEERKDAGWFLPVDDEGTQTEYARIASWVIDEKQGYKSTAIDEFFDVGDSWLVAKAAAEKMTIVTHERLNAQRKNRVLIPNVCHAFHIEYIDTIELIRRTGARFHLK